MKLFKYERVEWSSGGKDEGLGVGRGGGRGLRESYREGRALLSRIAKSDNMYKLQSITI